MQENMVAELAPSDVNSRPVDFELITNNTIILHESPVSSDVNVLFNSPYLGPMNSTVFQLQSSDHVDSPNLDFQQSSSNYSSSIFQSNISGNKDVPGCSTILLWSIYPKHWCDQHSFSAKFSHRCPQHLTTNGDPIC